MVPYSIKEEKKAVSGEGRRHLQCGGVGRDEGGRPEVGKKTTENRTTRAEMGVRGKKNKKSKGIKSAVQGPVSISEKGG